MLLDVDGRVAGGNQQPRDVSQEHHRSGVTATRGVWGHRDGRMVDAVWDTLGERGAEETQRPAFEIASPAHDPVVVEAHILEHHRMAAVAHALEPASRLGVAGDERFTWSQLAEERLERRNYAYCLVGQCRALRPRRHRTQPRPSPPSTRSPSGLCGTQCRGPSGRSPPGLRVPDDTCIGMLALSMAAVNWSIRSAVCLRWPKALPLVGAACPTTTAKTCVVGCRPQHPARSDRAPFGSTLRDP